MYSTTVGNKDIYGVTSCTRINANIKGIQLNADARVTDTTPQGLRPFAKSGATETSGGSHTVTSTGYDVFPVLGSVQSGDWGVMDAGRDCGHADRY